MKAMILAAGLGTRLRPLTNDRPKALVQIGGKTFLEIVLCRLRRFGVDEVIINLHHFPDIVENYLKAHGNFGMHIATSREDVLLDTGGGLKKAARFFLEGQHQNEPFIVHNVDVLSNIDLASMLQFHASHQALATLAVQDRKTSRYLLFDDRSRLCGREIPPHETSELIPGSKPVSALAFSGIHVVSPQLLEMLDEEGVFSIVVSYLRLAAMGKNILGFRADEYYWRDLGKPESVTQAEKDLQDGIVAQ